MSTTTTNLQLNKPAMSDTPSVTIPQLGTNFDTLDDATAVNRNLLGVKMGSVLTTFDGNNNLTQVVEKDASSNTLITTNITYNADGTVNTVTEITNGHTYVTTLNYSGGTLSATTPVTRTVS